MKQQLTEALEELSDRPGARWAQVDPSIAAVLDAARLVERLLPGECGSCRVCVHGRYEMHTATDWACAGPFTELRPRSICPDCHGSGQVWDEGIVEAVAKVLADDENVGPFETESTTRAVLSAIAQLAEKGEG